MAIKLTTLDFPPFSWRKESSSSSNRQGAVFYLYTSEEELSRGIAARQRSRHLRFARPPAERQLIRAREKTMKEKTVAAFILKIVVIVIVLAVLVIMAFGRDEYVGNFLVVVVVVVVGFHTRCLRFLYDTRIRDT